MYHLLRVSWNEFFIHISSNLPCVFNFNFYHPKWATVTWRPGSLSMWNTNLCFRNYFHQMYFECWVKWIPFLRIFPLLWFWSLLRRYNFNEFSFVQASCLKQQGPNNYLNPRLAQRTSSLFTFQFKIISVVEKLYLE